MLLLTTILSMTLQAGAPTWNLVDQERGRFSYDSSSLRVEGNRVTVLTQIENMVIPGGPARAEAELLLDCAGRTYALLNGRAYNAAGAVIHSREIAVADAVPAPIAPNTTEDRLRARVCPAA